MLSHHHRPIVTLTQTDKRATREHKSAYIEQIRSAIESHDSVYLFGYENMRSNKFKKVRVDFNGSGARIFLGKNKLMQIALGRSEEEEFQENLRHVAKRIVGGSVGLLVTSQSREEIVNYFAKLVEPDFARAGAVAEKEAVVDNDMLGQFPVSMMEQLRKLGMPVEIHDGKVQLQTGLESWRICREGETLSAEKCKLLVHFDYKLSSFRVQLLCRWADGEFELLDTDEKMS